MNPPVEREGSDRLKPIKASVLNVFEKRGAVATLQLVAALRRRELPTLPKLRTPDPANPAKSIEEGDALVIGDRFIGSSRRRQMVTLIALFPEEIPPRVEFRSYRKLIPEQVPGRTLLVPVGPPFEGHSLIFANAEKSTQWELIKSALEAIYRKPTGESPVLKS